jgi:hypothetical protein
MTSSAPDRAATLPVAMGVEAGGTADAWEESWADAPTAPEPINQGTGRP